MSSAQPYIGYAGWSLRSEYAEHFPDQGTHLERYAARFPAVEINSSFYRPHQPKTYARWAASVPAYFRFAVKAPKLSTHEQRLLTAEPILDRFLSEVSGLGDKLGPLLVQLPPGLPYNPAIAEEFFGVLRAGFDGFVVCEPRHPSWFVPDAEQLLVDFKVARVAADPAPVPQAEIPGGWNGLTYYRLHGSPQMYYSEYSGAFIATLAGVLRALRQQSTPAWCIFDNTAEGAATANALALLQQV